MSLTGVVVGAGDRGYDGYAKVLLDRPELGRIVAAADPDPARRDRFADRFGLGSDAMYPGWDELFAEGKLADYAIITTGDTHHVEPALLALAAGYHVLLEKPMALEESDCVRIVEAAEAADRTVAVCHVFRHSHLFAALGEVVASGELGDVTSIQLSENVAFWHYAHSYVRGYTRNSRVPWLLQKSCHDLDLLQWLAGSGAAEVSSFIRPTELTAANAPADAPEYCAQGCPHSRGARPCVAHHALGSLCLPDRRQRPAVGPDRLDPFHERCGRQLHPQLQLTPHDAFGARRWHQGHRLG